MPAMIMFDASGLGDEKGARRGQVRVKEDADDVIAKLGAAEGGFADFAPVNKPKDKVWVNRDQVQMVRSA